MASVLRTLTVVIKYISVLLILTSMNTKADDTFIPKGYKKITISLTQGESIEFLAISKEQLYQAQFEVNFSEELMNIKPVTDIIVLIKEGAKLSASLNEQIESLKQMGYKISFQAIKTEIDESILLLRRTESQIEFELITKNGERSQWQSRHNFGPSAVLQKWRQNIKEKKPEADKPLPYRDDSFNNASREYLYGDDGAHSNVNANFRGPFVANVYNLDLKLVVNSYASSKQTNKATIEWSALGLGIKLDRTSVDFKGEILPFWPDGFNVVERILNNELYIYIEKLQDNKRVLIYRGENLAEIPIVKYQPKTKEFYFSNYPRRISLSHFDWEMYYNPTISKKEFTDSHDGKETKNISASEILNRLTVFNINLETTKVDLTTQEQNTVLELVKTFKKEGPRSQILIGEVGQNQNDLVESALDKLPSSWTVLKLSPSELMSGTNLRGELEKKVQQLVELSRAQPLVLWLEDIHDFYSLGKSFETSFSFFSALKAQIQSGQIIIIGTSDQESYQDTIGKESKYDQIFQKLKMPVLSTTDVLFKLNVYFKANGISSIAGLPLESVAAQNLLKQTVEQLALLFPFYNEPFRTLDFFSKVIHEIKQDSSPFLNEMKQKKIYVEKFDLPNEAFDFVLKNEFNYLFDSVPELNDYVAKAKKKFSREIRGPIDLFMKTAFDTIHSQSMMTDLLNRKTSGPLLKVLLYGPPGSGKTVRAKAFAQALQIPILELSHSFINNNPDFMQKVAEKLVENPRTIILIDEIDRIQESSRQQILQLLAENSIVGARYTNGKKRLFKAPTTQALVIATTNLGSYDAPTLATNRSIGFLPQDNQQDNQQDTQVKDPSMAMIEVGLGEALFNRFTGRIFAVPLPDEKTYNRVLLGVLLKANQNKFLKSQQQDPAANQGLLFRNLSQTSQLEFIPQAWTLARQLGKIYHSQRLSLRQAMAETENLLNNWKAQKRIQSGSVMKCQTLFN